MLLCLVTLVSRVAVTGNCVTLVLRVILSCDVHAFVEPVLHEIAGLDVRAGVADPLGLACHLVAVAGRPHSCPCSIAAAGRCLKTAAVVLMLLLVGCGPAPELLASSSAVICEPA